MRTHQRLAHLFGALVPMAALLVTPSGDPARAALPDAPKPPPTFAHSFCPGATPLEPAVPYEPLQGLKLAAPLPDYVALMAPRPFPGRDPSMEAYPPGTSVVMEAGWKCKGFPDRAACSERFLHMAVPPGSQSDPQSLWPYWLVLQRGGDQRVLATWRDVRAWLGPIDSFADAALIATLHQHYVTCGVSTAQAHGTGYRLTAVTGEWCGGRLDSHVLDIGRDGSFAVVSSALYRLPNDCSYGRRPQGYVLDADVAETPHQSFVQAMKLEHASVEAFQQIVRFLSEQSAPGPLLRRIHQAARDEERHTFQMRQLVARYGAVPALRPVTSTPFRRIFQLALSNAVEGCVRETFAALLAWEQAEHAQDPVVGRVLASIARDETAHAALSWDLAAWLETKLTAAECAHLAVARAECFAQLREEWATPRAPELRHVAGLPTPARARQLIDHLELGLPALQAA